MDDLKAYQTLAAMLLYVVGRNGTPLHEAHIAFGTKVIAQDGCGVCACNAASQHLWGVDLFDHELTAHARESRQ